ncbi:hypothetical protein ABS311_20865 [Catenovulum sediminis]|uniref:Letm1 RBD domain-containing protein n=2 Tax=Catenovulum sediminis TaxID=1740262 RepID=A0ABV1RN09_9ALTE
MVKSAKLCGLKQTNDRNLMNANRKLSQIPVKLVKVNRNASRLRLRRTMLALKTALRQEKKETQEMMDIYRRHAKGQASKEELSVANQQFLDLLRGLGLGIFAVLPFAPITIPLIIKLGRKVGVEVMPSSFIPKSKVSPPDKKELK